jgi:hypothetical protein
MGAGFLREKKCIITKKKNPKKCLGFKKLD